MTQNKKIVWGTVLMVLFSVVAGVPQKIVPVFMGDVSDIGFVCAVFAQDEDTADAPEPNDEDTANSETPCPDPAKVVLRGLEEKKQAIEEMQNILDQEKKELQRYEEQIDEKLDSLEAMKEQIQKDLALLDEKKTEQELEEEAAYEAKMNRLVKMYAGMKPRDAAQIVNEMTLEVAREIFLRMRETSASQILAFVDSQKAAKISERLAFKRK
ncbi:MAG: MotE family protein [Desulfotignum sp.]